MIRAETFVYESRRTMQHAESLEWKSKSIRGDLREHGFQPLAERGRAHRDRDRAVGFEHKPDVLPRTRASALDETGDGEPVIASVDEPSLQVSLGVPAEFLQAAVQRGVIVTGIVGSFGFVRNKLSDRVGQLGFADQVLAPKSDGIDGEIPCRHVHQTLAEKIGFDASGRAEGADRGLAGHESRNLDLHAGNPVRPMQELRSLRGHDAAVGADVCSHVGPDTTAQPENSAVAPARDLQLAVDLARMIGGQEVFPPILDPFNRPTELARRKWNQKVFRIEFSPHAEPAADIE